MRTITIGRSSKCDIIIENDSISRIHAEISLVGNEYIYKDVSKNGTNIGGRMINNERLSIAPGANVLMANKVSLPWAQIYSLLPLRGSKPYSYETESETQVQAESMPINVPENYYYESEDRLGVGWGILAFLIPIAGWIMYFVWKDNTPKRAGNAGLLATISFALNLIALLAI